MFPFYKSNETHHYDREFKSPPLGSMVSGPTSREGDMLFYLLHCHFLPSYLCWKATTFPCFSFGVAPWTDHSKEGEKKKE